MNPERSKETADLMRTMMSKENVHRILDEAEERSPSVDGKIRYVSERQSNEESKRKANEQ